jgi:MoaA/NifB/PqqE/SkfB family radical SAM enzyme
MTAHVTGPAPVLEASGATAALDLSAVWSRCHAHLQPEPGYAALAPDQLHRCGLCGATQAFEVGAHLRYGADVWVQDTRVVHCPHCHRFSLPAATAAAHAASHPASVGQAVTAVNARLWAATPTFLNIEPTTRCNFSCWYCVGRQMVQADIEVDNFAKMLDNFPTVKAIALVGEGEPLMHKGFFEMAQMARERGIRVLLTSNGSAFSESVVRKLCETEVAYVSVSVDSVDPATFAQSRIDGDLARVWDGIHKLRQYRDSHGYQYPKIAIKGTLFTHTEEQMLPIVEEAKRRGADLFESFQPLNAMQAYVKIYPRAELKHMAELPQVTQRIAAQRPHADALLKNTQLFCAEEGIPGTNAGRPNGMRPNCDEEWLYSLLGGDVTPCCQVKDVLDPNWNLFKRPVQEILADEHYERMRFNLWNGLFPSYCSGCWKTAPQA